MKILGWITAALLTITTAQAATLDLTSGRSGVETFT